ncbi:hypothetical protein PVAP13_7NG100068 [Panicum virgatum]|uniref:Uncharacterized protein n=1 Tax=Panicum virgatum TaxID=38727 RepID=A0A8T0PWY8_PANVG|nr:hypothetical protein PVAP13_7NG100068 [Panicum virgatum]
MMQVMEFTCGGFVVGLSSSHTLTDGLGAGQFINAVADYARGLPKPRVAPIWARDIVPQPAEAARRAASVPAGVPVPVPHRGPGGARHALLLRQRAPPPAQQGRRRRRGVLRQLLLPGDADRRGRRGGARRRGRRGGHGAGRQEAAGLRVRAVGVGGARRGAGSLRPAVRGRPAVRVGLDAAGVPGGRLWLGPGARRRTSCSWRTSPSCPSPLSARRPSRGPAPGS